MSETTTETPTTPTEGTPTSEAVATSLLTSTDPAATTTQQQSEPVKEEKPAETTKPAETVKTEGAPESYEFTAPEGKTYDVAVLDTFSAAAKASNLTQEDAQKLLDTMAPALADRQTAQIKVVTDGWAEASRTDKEFGGDKLKENLGIAKKAIDTYGDTELKTLLETSGLGNHPAVIRAFFKAGQTLKEDGFVKGAPAGSQKDLTSKLYPNTPSKE